MKKLIFIIIVFASFVNVSAQIEINSSGQVGVGTDSPQHQLDVAGDARVTGNILLGSTFDFLGTTGNIPITFKVNNDKNPIIIDSIVQMKNEIDIFKILIFMKEKGIRSIYGYGKGEGIKIILEGNRYPCFNFLYRPDFNPDDENVKLEIANISNTKTKNWIYILGNGWYIRGVKCF